MDNNEHRPAFSNPHWKADESCVKEPDSSKSIRIPVRALNIIWGNDPRFWQWIKLTEEDTKSTELEEGTVLLQVNWIQVTGKLSVMPCMAASTSTRDYEIVYIVKFRADAFGWHSVPIKFKVRFNGEEMVKSVLLESYRKKQNRWHEISGGIFTVSSKDSLGAVVEFGMLEDGSDWWKGGLVLAGIKIRPKLG